MHNLKTLSDQVIHQQMLATSKKERELTLFMISLIEEASRRKFYLDLGFATLFDYMTIGLKYSSGAAMRRISSARLVTEIPEIKEQILDGTLSLTNVSQAEQFIRNEAKHDHVMSVEEKKEVLKCIAGKSVRQAESTLIHLSTAPEQSLRKDKIKVASPTVTQITFSASPEFMSQLEEAKGLLGHRLPNATISEVLAEVMKFGLAGLRKQKFKVKQSDHESCVKKRKQEAFVSENEMANKESCVPGKEKRQQEAAVSEANEQESSMSRETVKQEPSMSAETGGQESSMSGEMGKQESSMSEKNFTAGAGNNASNYISAAVKRAVSKRDRERCVVIHPVTGKPCGSQISIEFDHYPIVRHEVVERSCSYGMNNQ